MILHILDSLCNIIQPTYPSYKLTIFSTNTSCTCNLDSSGLIVCFFYRKIDTLQEPAKEEEEPKEDDPWAGLAYTIDLETGKEF